MFDEHIIFHLSAYSAYAMTWFCLFFTVFDPDIQYSFRICIKASASRKINSFLNLLWHSSFTPVVAIKSSKQLNRFMPLAHAVNIINNIRTSQSLCSLSASFDSKKWAQHHYLRVTWIRSNLRLVRCGCNKTFIWLGAKFIQDGLDDKGC